MLFLFFVGGILEHVYRLRGGETEEIKDER